MTKYRFNYIVHVAVSLTADDIECLIVNSKQHYDGTIKAAAKSGGRFYGWRNQIKLVGGDELVLSLSPSDLGLMLKALELGYAPSNTRTRLVSMITACMEDIRREYERLNKA